MVAGTGMTIDFHLSFLFKKNFLEGINENKRD